MRIYIFYAFISFILSTILKIADKQIKKCLFKQCLISYVLEYL